MTNKNKGDEKYAIADERNDSLELFAGYVKTLRSIESTGNILIYLDECNKPYRVEYHDLSKDDILKMLGERVYGRAKSRPGYAKTVMTLRTMDDQYEECIINRLEDHGGLE